MAFINRYTVTFNYIVVISFSYMLALYDFHNLDDSFTRKTKIPALPASPSQQSSAPTPTTSPTYVPFSEVPIAQMGGVMMVDIVVMVLIAWCDDNAFEFNWFGD